MQHQRIERVDDIPLLLHWLSTMKVQEVIDSIWQPHGNWDGLRYGQLAQLFIAYVIHTQTHTLCTMEEWAAKHRTVIQQCTGWDVALKDTTDDRLGRMVEVLGLSDTDNLRFQQEMGKHLIHAYHLPTDVARFDTTSFNVYHAPGPNASEGLLRFGHSKNHRPDLLQFKQGLATLDPAGVPLYSTTLPGNTADDPLYFPAWIELKKTIGHGDFLYVADSKASALKTRAAIDKEGGSYLFPLPKTGDVPQHLCQFVLNPPTKPQPIFHASSAQQQPSMIGQGFVVHKQMSADIDGSSLHTWSEQWFVVQSCSYAESQTEAWTKRIENAEQELQRIKPKKGENAQELLQRAEKILKGRNCESLFSLEVWETVTHQEKFQGRGRPKADSPRILVELRHPTLSFQRSTAAIAQVLLLAGWRIYVSNVPAHKMSLEQSVHYYRDEWQVERGFHRFKEGSLPALPVYLHLHDRIKGLMLLLTVALQAITLIEYVARRQLAAQQEHIAGLVPGNPKMKTQRPTAERLLSQFGQVHLLIKESDDSVSGYIVETLNPLQIRILDLLGIPITIYAFTFRQEKFKDSS